MRHWSLEDDALLDKEKHETLDEGQPESLKYRTDGYEWYLAHQGNRNYVQMKPGGKKTQIENCDKLWVVPSSSAPVDSDLKALAMERMGQRFQITSNHFDEYVRIRTSCWILEQKGKNFYCDCPIGSKGHMCKHFPGISYKLGLLEVTADVRSKPLGQKRKRGRPQMAKAGHCLVRSPEKSSNVPVAHYHPPSPELALPSETVSLEILDIDNIPVIIANEEVVRSAPTKRALSNDLDDDESVMMVLPRRSKRVKNTK